MLGQPSVLTFTIQRGRGRKDDEGGDIGPPLTSRGHGQGLGAAMEEGRPTWHYAIPPAWSFESNDPLLLNNRLHYTDPELSYGRGSTASLHGDIKRCVLVVVVN